MQDNRASTQIVTGFIIFIIIGMALNGVTTEPAAAQTVTIDIECADYTTDNDNDGQNGLIDDTSCQDYPYYDGLGESDTPNTLGGQSGNQYQPYFDLTVDFVRNFVKIECAGNLAGCVGTNYQWESQFYCWFSMNIMSQEFGTMFDKFFLTSPNTYGMTDDGSSNVFVNVCKQLSPPSGNLPIISHQDSEPLPENSGGGFKDGGESSEK